VTFVTTAKTDAEAMSLLRELGIPFVRRDEQQPDVSGVPAL
jgi:hypothetical protein